LKTLKKQTPARSRTQTSLSKEEIARVKAIIGQHAMQVDKTEKQNRERIFRLLDVLYAEGVKKHSVPAIKSILIASSARPKSASR
jgi:hypothetical protein